MIIRTRMRKIYVNQDNGIHKKNLLYANDKSVENTYGFILFIARRFLIIH
jgi:hypothetical protein